MFSYLFVLCLALVGSHGANRLCYGNIDSLHPKGMHNGGVPASERAARQDYSDLHRIESCIDKAANKYCIQASLLGGICSRESRAGRLLRSSHGYGDHGHAYGVMQCDVRYSGLDCTRCGYDDCCHFNMMTKFFIKKVKSVARKKPNWTRAQQLQGAVAAYNFGVSNVQSWGGLDIGSTNNDYSGDVMARAKWLKSRGWN